MVSLRFPVWHRSQATANEQERRKASLCGCDRNMGGTRGEEDAANLHEIITRASQLIAKEP
jgi:hypothetical protein